MDGITEFFTSSGFLSQFVSALVALLSAWVGSIITGLFGGV